MAIDNCRKCGAIFQRVQSPLCRGCEEHEHNKKSDLYRYIHENPGIDILLLAQKFDIKTQELERMIFSGELGTASQLIKFHCSRCKAEFSPSARVGYFCDNCQKNVSSEVQAAKREGDPPPQPASTSSGGGMYTYKPSKPMEETDRPSRREREGSGRAHFGFKRIS